MVKATSPSPSPSARAAGGKRVMACALLVRGDQAADRSSVGHLGWAHGDPGGWPKYTRWLRERQLLARSAGARATLSSRGTAGRGSAEGIPRPPWGPARPRRRLRKNSRLLRVQLGLVRPPAGFPAREQLFERDRPCAAAASQLRLEQDRPVANAGCQPGLHRAVDVQSLQRSTHQGPAAVVAEAALVLGR